MSTSNYTEANRAFEGVFIPKVLWLNSILTWTEKIILLEIKSLDKREEENGRIPHCFASNAYIAKFAQCSETKVKEALKLFKAYGIIEILHFDGRNRTMTVVDNWEELLQNIDEARSRLDERTFISEESRRKKSTKKADEKSLSEGQKASDIIYNNINNSYELFNKNEKKEKEINKEISTSCNEVNTAISVSLKDDERITPTPIRDICIKHIEQFTSDTDIQKLLIDYLDSRLHVNANLSELSFKASLGTLKSAQTYCENPALLKYYTTDVILNATAGTYSQFKPILSSVYKKTNTSLESTSIVKKTPFGDTSICIPAESNLDLALDENGNPIKF